MPSGLDAPARKVWARWVAILLDLGVLSGDCGPALESLVRAEIRVRKARRDVARYGAIEISDRGARRSAWAHELDAAEIEFRRWCQEFGVTPSARSRVRATAPTRAAPAETERDRAKKRFFGGGA